MAIVIVPVPASTGTLAVSVASPHYPQALAGVLWRYRPDRTPDGAAGEYTPSSLSAPIGTPADNEDHYFMIEGVVIAHGDNPPSRYEVVVTITLDDIVVHSDVPTQGGTGTVGDDDVGFTYTFQITRAA